MINKVLIGLVVTAVVVLGAVGGRYWYKHAGDDTPRLVIPAVTNGEANEFVTIKADTNGNTVQWVSLDAGLRMLPHGTVADTKTAVVFGQKGRYRVLAYTAVNGTPSSPSIGEVVLGDAPPGPNPPNPPEPTDPFVKTLTDVYQKETDPAKATKLTDLVKVYANAKEVINDEMLETVNDLRKAMSAKITEKVGEFGLAYVRRAISDELVKLLPTDPSTKLTADVRALCVKNFERIHEALKGVK